MNVRTTESIDLERTLELWCGVAASRLGASKVEYRNRSISAPLDATLSAACLSVPIPGDLDHGSLVAISKVGRIWSSQDVEELADTANCLATALSQLNKNDQLHRVESQLSHQLRCYEAIVAASSEIVWSTSIDGSMLESCPSWERFTGQTQSEYAEFGWRDAIHPGDRERLSDHWRESLEIGQSWFVEYRLRHHSGDYRWIAERSVPIKGGDGEVVGWVGISTDVNERRAGEEAETLAGLRREALIRAMSIMVWTGDESGRLVEGTRTAWCSFTGQSDDDWENRRWLKAVHPDDRARVSEMWFGPHTAAQEAGYEYRLRNVSGNWHWMQERVVPVLSPGQSGDVVSGFVGMTSDITESRGVRLELEEREFRFRALVEASAQIVWTACADGSIREDSPSWRRFTGCSLEEWLAGDWSQYVHPEDRAIAIERWRRTVENGVTVESDYRIRSASGNWRFIHERVVPLRSGLGAVRGWVAMAADVTERTLTLAANREQAGLLKQALKAAGLMAWTWDSDRDELRLSGDPSNFPKMMTSCTSMSQLIALLSEQDAEALEAAILESATHNRMFEATFGLRDELGHRRWISISGSAFAGSDISVLKAQGTVRDITETKIADERRNLLVGEIAHRGKNLLAVIQSMAGMTLNDELPVSEARKVFLDRLMSLARSHSFLTERDWEGVPIDEVIRLELATFAGRVVVNADRVLLNPSTAQSVALVIHELATNAAKHGALSLPSGRVNVSATLADIDTEKFLEFRWQESGGPAVTAPIRSGFGSVLLRRLIQGFDVDGIIEYDQLGLRIAINIPLDMIVPSHRSLTEAAAA